MDKSKVIEFSNKVRDKLNAEVRSQAAYYGIFPKEIHSVEEHADSVVINGSVFNSRIKNQRFQLVKQIKEKGYEQVMEEVTYTWFNRLVALKFNRPSNRPSNRSSNRSSHMTRSRRSRHQI